MVSGWGGQPGAEGAGAVADFGVIDIRTTGDGAGADDDDELGSGDGGPGLLEGEGHILGDRAGDQEAIRVARGVDELDAEPGEVEDDGVEHVALDLAAVAAAGADLAELE